MAPIKLPKTDVLIVGAGWTGLAAAYELAHNGQKCVVLERGPYRHDAPDFQAPEMHDDLKYAHRYGLMMDTRTQTLTFRNNRDQNALPMRRLGSFLPGDGLGGAGVHWNGQLWRPLPADLNVRSHYAEKYGEEIFDDDLTIQDYGVTYEELEPHFDFFEKVSGCSGQAGNLGGQTVAGGNPFEGPRSDDYPNPPLTQPLAPTMFAEAAGELGYHPFPFPAANASRAYVNPYGAQLHACTYCGYCERFGCGYYAKADPIICIYDRIKEHENFELRTGAYVMKVNKSADGTRATGVTYVDPDGREYEQEADVVLLCAYALWNVHLLLVSQIGTPYDPATGEGTLGKNYAYQTLAGTSMFWDRDMNFNPFMGAGALGVAIDDLNGDNFDHGEPGFVGGGWVGVTQTNGRPIGYHPVPSDSPGWGAEWKRNVAKYYNSSTSIGMHLSSVSTRQNHLDLDPTYTDAFGRPLLRMTFDFPDNDVRMSQHIAPLVEEIGRVMNPDHISTSLRAERPYSIVPYQSTHNTGGAIMGTDPSTSVVNRYCQHWDLHNLFVFGACLFPQNHGYNPTGTLMGLAYWTIDALKSRYLSDPKPLVEA